LRGAADVLDYGRRLDLADRYINSRATKYLLRANRCQQADDTINLFVKTDKEYSLSLFDLQCMWFEIGLGQAQLRCGNIPAALKAFMSTEVHFKDIIDDQFDFHSYCFRPTRCNLQAYVEMLRHCDELRCHRFFVAGGLGLVRCYIALHKQRTSGKVADTTSDTPSGSDGAVAEKKPEGPDTSQMTSKQLKAYKRKQRQKAAKLAKAKAAGDEDDEAEVKKSEDEEMGKTTRKKRGSEEPDGVALSKVEDPLSEADKWVKTLAAAHKGAVTLHATITPRARLDVALAQVEVSILRGAFLAALQALKRAQEVAEGSAELAAEVHVWHVRLLSAIAAGGDNATPQIKELLKRCGLQSFDAQAVAADFASKQANAGVSYGVAVSAATALLELDASSSTAAQLITGVDNYVGVTPQLASEGYSLLQSAGEAQQKAAEQQKATIDSKFPLCKLHSEPLTASEPNAVAIGPNDELAALKED